MVRHNLTRGASVAALGLALTAGGVIPLAAPAAADTPAPPQEVVVPPAYHPDTRHASVYRAEAAEEGEADSVGAEGVFHTEAGAKSTLWTRFSDGKSFPVTDPEKWVAPKGTSTDVLAYVYPDHVELRHADGTVRTVAVPEHLTGVKVYGSTVVAFDTAAKTAHLLTAKADGSTGDVRIEEPEGFGYTTAVAGDATSIVLPGPVTDGKRRHVVVSAETGKVQGLTPAVPESYTRVKLSPAYLATYSTDKTGDKVLVASRTDLSAPLTPVTVKSYDLPLDHVNIVGDWLTYNRSNNVEALPINGGGTPVELVKESYRPAAGPDGTVVVVGGTGAADWGIRRITAGADGKPVVSTVKKLPGYPARIERLTLAQGQLAVIDDSAAYSHETNPRPHQWSRMIGAGSTPTYGERTEIDSSLDRCAEGDLVCAEYWGTGDGRFVTRIGGSLVLTGRQDFIATHQGDKARVRDVNGSYMVVDTTEGSTPVQRVLALTSGIDTSKVLEQRTPVASALWGSRLWTAGAENGAVTAKDLKTGASVESLNTGAPCVPDELQAAGRWLYWSCGANGPAGVYDRTAKSSKAVPSGEALLGDGYVVTHDKAAGKLVLTGTDAAKPVSRVVGDLPDTGTSQRRVRWSVDKFGGHIAYADAAEQVHIVPSGIAPQPLELLLREDAPVVHASGMGSAITSVTPSRPLGAWTLTARHVRSGKVSVLDSGTDGRWLNPVWDGRDKNRDPLPNGLYAWTMTSRPADGVGAEVKLTGTTILRGAQSPASDSFTSLPTKRVMDTRDGTGVTQGKLGAKDTVTLDLRGLPGIDEHLTTSVALHVTATNAGAGTFISAYPAYATRSSASNLNVPAGKTVSNLVVVPVTGGKVTFYNHAGTVDLIADLAGANAYDDGKGALYQPMTPWRALDTRTGLGAPRAKVQGGSRAHLSFRGTALGGTDVTAVVLNLTATNVTKGTFVAGLQTGGQVVGSHLNPGPGETRSNLVVVPVKDGGIDLYNHNGAVDLIADVAGYYTSSNLGSLYEPLNPARLMDSRNGTGVAKAKVGAKGTVTLTVAGKGGVPATGATAVVLNVTATNATAGTYVTAYPYGTTRTSASNLNVPAGATVSNLVVVPVKDGKVTFYNHNGATDLIADVQGFYAE
ncbi:hypothetical protein ACIGEZ_07645 [Streptomyces sp. NPDC085481]|uniref:hypothetical protein n=1 Tax=Streptomyces sp. NPDC085481 TaxID=3365727 RepID=UPI0037D4AA66